MKTRLILGAVLIVAIAVIVIAYLMMPKSSAPAPAQTTLPATETAQNTGTSTATTTSYTMAQVEQHNTSASCWSAINGKVYDLTAWISEHPGGPEHIIPLCGTDGSAAFNAQHEGQGAPEAALAQMYIGNLSQ